MPSKYTIKQVSAWLCGFLYVFLYVFLYSFSYSQTAHAKIRAVPDTQISAVVGSESVFTGSYALVIGNFAYKQDQFDPLKSVEEEVKTVQKALYHQGYTVISNTNLSAQGIEIAIRNFIRMYGQDPNHRLVIYFAGHGESYHNSGGLVGVDAQDDPIDLIEHQKAISLNQVHSLIGEAKARHVLVLLNSCFAGNLLVGIRGDIQRSENVARILSTPVWEYITAGSRNEQTKDNTIFADAIAELLNADVEPPKDADALRYVSDGIITTQEIFALIQKKMQENHFPNTPQYASLRGERASYLFFLSRGYASKLQCPPRYAIKTANLSGINTQNMTQNEMGISNSLALNDTWLGCQRRFDWADPYTLTSASLVTAGALVLGASYWIDTSLPTSLNQDFDLLDVVGPAGYLTSAALIGFGLNYYWSDEE